MACNRVDPMLGRNLFAVIIDEANFRPSTRGPKTTADPIVDAVCRCMEARRPPEASHGTALARPSSPVDAR